MCYKSHIRIHRAKDDKNSEGDSGGDQNAHDSLDEVVGEVVDEIDREPTPVEGEDRFDVMADEIAAVLRTTHESAARLQAEAEQKATARIDEATAKAAALLADAETAASTRHDEAEAAAQAKADEADAAAKAMRDEAEAAAKTIRDEAEAAAKTRVDEATAEAEHAAAARSAEADEHSQAQTREASELLAEATALLEQARERDRTIRQEADVYAEARKAELHAEATSNRDTTAELLARSKQLFADAERELSNNIQRSTASLSELASIQDSMKAVHDEQAQLDLSPPTEATEGNQVIDLTDGDGGESDDDETGSAPGAAKADELGEKLQSASAKANDRLSNWPPPPPPSED